jgi:hypothetical protein
MSFNRRTLLGGLGGAALGAALGRRGHARAETSTRPRLLIVLTGTGGASIIDGPLAIRASESRAADTLNVFPDAEVSQPEGSPLRAVDHRGESVGSIPAPFSADQSSFVRKYHREMLVVTGTGTSVNHQIGQRRSVTGNEAWSGRTLQELVALHYGDGLPLPNVHLATGTAFTERGSDRGLPSWAYGEPVADPALWPLALDGKRGLRTPDPALVERARTLRDERLDPESRFARVFARSPRLAAWTAQRGEPQRRIEAAELVDKLMLFPESERYPLTQFGLRPSPAATRVRELFPKFETDPLEAQAALAFLLLKFRVSTTVTLGPGQGLVLDVSGGAQAGLPKDALRNTPIAFDFAHQAHRSTQAVMWDRLYRIADGLITLLREEEDEGGASLWDRSLLYCATEFGRTRGRPAGAAEFGSGHDLNNGSLIVSPLVQGDRILGGVDPDTGMTYGYDPVSGAPDRGREMPEATLFAGLLQAMGIETPASLPSVPAIRGRA